MKSHRAIPSFVTLVAASIVVAAACGAKVSVDKGGQGGDGGNGGMGGTVSSVTSGFGGVGATGPGPTTSVSTGLATTSKSSVDVVTTTGAGAGALAAECNADADCGVGYKCLKSSDNDSVLGGGPAGGYCTLPCDSDAACPGAGSACLIGPDGKGECFLGCAFGEPPIMYLNDPLDLGKCLGREDLRCETTENGSNLCLPTCGADAHCNGRKCDPRTQVCVDTPSAGKPLGAKCDPMSMVPDCAGVCLPVNGVNGDAPMCTSPCTMGGEVPYEFECGGPAAGICIYSPAGTGVGDSGFCAQSCTAQDQCQAPNYFCFNINLPDNGLCLDAGPCMQDSDCNILDAKCIATTLGSYCMSPGYPLGALQP